MTEPTESRLEVHMGSVGSGYMDVMQRVGCFGADKFLRVERLGLAGMGLPAMRRQGSVAAKVLGRKCLLSGACNDIIERLCL